MSHRIRSRLIFFIKARLDDWFHGVVIGFSFISKPIQVMASTAETSCTELGR